MWAFKAHFARQHRRHSCSSLTDVQQCDVREGEREREGERALNGRSPAASPSADEDIPTRARLSVRVRPSVVGWAKGRRRGLAR